MAFPPNPVHRLSTKLDAWTRQRAISKAVRHGYTDVLKDHGATGPDYGVCTNTMYIGVLGKDAKSLKTERGLGPKGNLRDHMTIFELAVLAAGEALASERIIEVAPTGGEECRIATARSAASIRLAIEADRRDRPRPPPTAANDPVNCGEAA